MRGRRWLALGLALAALGCATEPLDEDVLATYRGGEVRYAAVEQVITAMPRGERQPEDGDFAAWYEELAREVATREILLVEAELAGDAETPEFLKQWDEARRQIVVSFYVTRELPALPRVTRDEIRAWYDEHREGFDRPGWRRVYTLFLRRGDDRDDEELLAKMTDLRERVGRAEDFPTLAARHSESETRHRNGQLGVVRPGQLPPQLEEIVFALGLREVSEPIRTKSGFHLFWIDSLVEAQVSSFEDVRPQIAERLADERRREAMEQLELEGELPEGSYVPSAEDLRALLSSPDDRALLLRIGDFELRRGDLERRFVAVSPGGGNRGRAEMVASIRRRELLYQRAVAEGVLDAPELLERLVGVRELRLITFHLQRRLDQLVDGRGDTLERYYDDHRNRFHAPLRLQLQRLQVEVGPEANRVMADLERLVTSINDGESTLAAVAGEIGGEVEALGWLSLSELRSRNETSAILAVESTVGQVTDPYRHRGWLEALEVVGREEPDPLPFEQAKVAVRRDYLQQHGPQVYEELREQLLTGRDFRPWPEQIRAVATRVTGAEPSASP